ncbi:MAG: hypothetical protein Q8P67_08305 [archaeon]|nr:hypothetical protein [archaeon]
MMSAPGQTETLQNRVTQIREARARKLERARRAEEKEHWQTQELLRQWEEHERGRYGQQCRRADVEKRNHEGCLQHLAADVSADLERFTPQGRLKRARIRRREEEEDLVAERLASLAPSSPPAIANSAAAADSTISTALPPSSPAPCSSSTPNLTPDWELLTTNLREAAKEAVQTRVAAFFEGEVDDTLVGFIQDLFSSRPSQEGLEEELTPIFADDAVAFVRELWTALLNVKPPVLFDDMD